MTGLRALVTGGGGFVGANLVRRLLTLGADVHLLVRAETDPWRLGEILPQVRLHLLDLTNGSAVTQAVRQAEPEVVFHLAKHRGDPARLDYLEAYNANLLATLNLLQAAADVKSVRRFIHGGSSLEYDLAKSPLSESDAPAPVTVHGVTKAAATLLCQQFAAQTSLPVVVLRFFTVYGPWEGGKRFVPTVMSAALERRGIRMTRSGLAHDWIYVGDVVDACLCAVTAGGIGGEVLNVATGTSSTNEQVVTQVEELIGAPIVRLNEPFPEREWDTDRWVADASKTERLMGWRATTDLREGLTRTLRWFEERANEYGEYRVKRGRAS